MAKSSRKPPWKKANPRKRTARGSSKLTASQKAAAKRRAARAGRHYPNLVDNMWASRRKSRSKS